MESKKVYGVVKSGPNAGQLTECSAKDPTTCRYHAVGSHEALTQSEYEDKAEKIAAENALSRTSSLGMRKNDHNESNAKKPNNGHEDNANASAARAIAYEGSEYDLDATSTVPNTVHRYIPGNPFEDATYNAITDFDQNQGTGDVYSIDSTDLDYVAHQILSEIPGGNDVTPEYRNKFTDALSREIRDKNEYDSDNQYGVSDDDMETIISNVRSRMAGKHVTLRGVREGQRDPIADDDMDESLRAMDYGADMEVAVRSYDQATPSSADPGYTDSDYYEIPEDSVKNLSNEMYSIMTNGKGEEMSDEYKEKFDKSVRLELEALNRHPGSYNGQKKYGYGLDPDTINLLTANVIMRMKGKEPDPDEAGY